MDEMDESESNGNRAMKLDNMDKVDLKWMKMDEARTKIDERG